MAQAIDILGQGRWWIETCCNSNCKVQFMMTDAYHQTALSKRENFKFHCPNGHAQWYVSGESDLDKMRRERDRAVQKVAEREDTIRELEGDKERLGREKSALRGQITRVKNRVKNGVCPCCNRTFANLAAHMKSKHPAYTNEKIA